MMAWKRACTCGCDRYSISFQLASLCCEDLKITRLEPPAMPAPKPVGPGNGAVPHLPSMPGGWRSLNSRTFHGPDR